MKKIVFVLAALVVAAPAFGVAVDINAIQVGTTTDVNITYDASGGKLPRAFALNIWVDSGQTITGITNFLTGESTSGSKGYGIFPASFDRHINPADPNWNDVNYTPVAEPNDLPGDTLGGLETNGITIEMGSLYAGPNEGPNSPATSGTLCTITVSGGCTVSLSANVGRGKVVFEDSTEASPINLYGCTVIVDVNVPDVLAMNLTEATAAIEANDLNAVVVAYECNDVELADEVLAQNPIGGTVVSSGSDVNLWVSTGQPYVPNVVDMNEADAIAAIDAVTYISAGTPTYECNDTIADGNVISTTPGEGYATCGTTVAIVVSTGQPYVPNVVDMNEADAIAAIDAVAYISAGTPTYECNDVEAAGEVLSQSPGAGVAPCGTTVDLVISTGACVCTVPNVVNMAKADANTAIINAGFVVGNITYAYSDVVPTVGNVISSNPASGAQPACGTAVAIVVSLGQASCTTCRGDTDGNGWVMTDDYVDLRDALNATAPNFYFQCNGGREHDCMDWDNNGWVMTDDYVDLRDALNATAPNFYYQCGSEPE